MAALRLPTRPSSSAKSSPLVIEEMPRGCKPYISGYCRQQFWQPVKVNNGRRQTKKVGVTDVKPHLRCTWVHDRHHAKAQLGLVIRAAMVCVLQVVCPQVNSQKPLDVLEALPAVLSLEQPTHDLDSDVLRGC